MYVRIPTWVVWLLTNENRNQIVSILEIIYPTTSLSKIHLFTNAYRKFCNWDNFAKEIC